jgi:hypothetical protein
MPPMTSIGLLCCVRRCCHCRQCQWLRTAIEQYPQFGHRQEGRLASLLGLHQNRSGRRLAVQPPHLRCLHHRQGSQPSELLRQSSHPDLRKLAAIIGHRASVLRQDQATVVRVGDYDLPNPLISFAIAADAVATGHTVRAARDCA